MKKTSSYFHSLIISRRLIGVFVAVAAAVATHSAYPQGVPTYHLTLIENSSTNLQLTYDGPAGAGAFTVTPTPGFNDRWTITSKNIDLSFNMFTADWQEPEGPTGTNVNAVVSAGPDTLSVTSDATIVGGVVLGNDTTAPGFVGFDDSGAVAGNIDLTFNDLGDQPTSRVPDGESTLGLLALAGAGLLGFRRLSSFRLA